MGENKTRSGIEKPSVLFISWAPYCPRSDRLAEALGGKSYMVYVQKIPSRAWAVWLKYLIQGVRTLGLLLKHRPRVTFVMSPPVFANLPVWLFHRLRPGAYVIDAHTAAFLHHRWRPLWFVQRFFSRSAITTIVTNEYLKGIMEEWGVPVTVIADLFMVFKPASVELDDNGFNVMLVSSFNPDEPIDACMEAARRMPDVKFKVTGDLQDANPDIAASKPENVEFTGFLPIEQYAGYLKASDAAMVLTTRDHTMQRGAYEAVSLGTPVITSSWPLLKKTFPMGTVFVDNSPEGIVGGVREMQRHHQRYRDEVSVLNAYKLGAWEENLKKLRSTIASSLSGA